MRKLILLFVICILIFQDSNSQYVETLTNNQFNQVLSYFKGSKSDFESYNFNNFPCSLCSGGSFYIKNDSSLESSYTYKGISFKGVLKSPRLNYDEKNKTLYVTSVWYNNSKSGGYKSANLSFEFSFGSDLTNWNTILRFQAGDTEMVAYFYLLKRDLNNVYAFLINGTNFKQILVERERQVLIAAQNKIFIDSIKKDNIEKEIIKKQLIIIENQRIKKITDSLSKKKTDSLFINLKIGDTFLDGIVLNIINDSVAVLISIEEKFIDYGTLKNLLNNKPEENSWSIPTGEDLDYLKKVINNNSYFNDKFNSTILQKEKFEYYKYTYWHTNGLKQLKSVLLVPANYDFNNAIKNQIPNSFKARIRFIKRYII